MDNQRLRNLTTRFLHTNMGDIYEDIEILTGEKGIMTHMLPRACDVLEPYLREFIKDPRFWEKKFDPTHTGETEVPPMTPEKQKEFWERYEKLPSPFEKLKPEQIVVVAT